LVCTINISHYQFYKTFSINENIFIKLFKFNAKDITNIKKNVIILKNNIKNTYYKK